MKASHILSFAFFVSVLAASGAAEARQSTTTWGNGKTTSSTRSWTNNGNGTVTKNSSFTGPNGNTGTRSVTRGDGTATVTYGNGDTRTTTHSPQ